MMMENLDSHPNRGSNPESIFELLQTLNKQFGDVKDKLLALPMNWDGENAQKFGVDIFKRILNFLELLMIGLWKQGQSLPFPQILPCPEGSIDVNWETEALELLVNFTFKERDVLTLYGEAGDKNEIELTIPIQRGHQVILPWIQAILTHGQ
jgi:hypothetical protein